MKRLWIIGIFLFLQIPISFAQMSASNNSQILPDLGNLTAKAKILAKPSDPFDVTYGDLSGEVKVNVTVNEKGNVINAEAVSGDERLRFAAVTAAQESKFNPYLVKEKAVRVKGYLTFQFGAPNNPTLSLFIDKEISDRTKKNEAQSLYDKGDYDGAIKIITEIINYFSSDFEPLEFRSRCYFKLKDYKNALKDLNDSIEIGQKNTAKFNFQGDIYLQLIDYAKAVESYTKVIKLDPKNPIAFGSRGYVNAKLSKMAESTADFKKVIELDPKDKYAIYNLEALANNRKVLSREEHKALRQIYYV